MNQKNKSIYLGFILLLILAVAGCVTTAEMFHGDSVSPEQVIAIQESGPNKSYDQNFDIIISYEFVRSGDVLEISGQAILTDRYPQIYASLKYLHVYLFFLDDTSRVLETIALASSMFGTLDERFEFSKSLNIPTGAVGISFGYDGEAKEGGDHSASTSTFYRLPLKKR